MRPSDTWRTKATANTLAGRDSRSLECGFGRTAWGSYDRFVSEFVDSYAQVLHRIAHGAGASVTHCTAGRDRTGVFSAVLLTALGVPWDVVVDDYLLTDRYRLTDADVERTATLLLHEVERANVAA